MPLEVKPYRKLHRPGLYGIFWQGPRLFLHEVKALWIVIFNIVE